VSGPQRPLYNHADLRRLLAPRSVAVLGVSSNPGSFGTKTLANLVKYFDGPIYPVNPKYDDLLGHRCYPSIAALPEAPDCVVLAVPRDAVEGCVEECAAAGVGGVVIYASGYAETGLAERVAMQQRLTELARRSGMRIMGPNCMGFLNLNDMVLAAFSSIMNNARRPQRSGVALVSQSGAIGFGLAQSMESGANIAYVVTAGNSCDVDIADEIAFMAEEPGCTAIACVFEGLPDPMRFLEAAEIAWRAGKPLVVCKLGVGKQGAAMALSHTGSLAGSHAAYIAAFQRVGIIVVDDLTELIERATFFAKAPTPAQTGVAVLTPSGGAAIASTDKAEAHGVALPALSTETRQVLDRYIPEFGHVGNPSDVTAMVAVDTEAFVTCCNALISDPQYGTLVLSQTGASANVYPRLKPIAARAGATGKIVCLIWICGWIEGPGYLECERDPNIAVFRSVDRCFETLAMWQRRAEREGQQPALAQRLSPPEAARKSARLIDDNDGDVLVERAAKSVLSTYGVDVVRDVLTHSADEAAAAASGLGWPVALKVESPDLPHKTEAGVIRLGLADGKSVRAAFAEIMVNASKVAPAGRIEGVLVQPMVPAGIELMVGGRVDPQFGPLIVVGLGGIMVELLDDTSVALAPIGTSAARAMLDRLKGKALLNGFRGSEPVDMDRLARTVVHVSEFLADNAAEVAELDINPIICAGDRVVAVDALIVRKPKADRQPVILGRERV
jgi:acyl-CoA synthetase (NDP forming)